MRVQLVDPSAFTPPYDHALCSALAAAGADVELVTSRFAYGDVPAPDGYRLSTSFYRHARGEAGSRLRRATKLAEHVPDMLALRRRAARGADIVHFQWLTLQWLDALLLPGRPTVLTAHDLLPREPRPGQAAGQRRLYERVDAIIAHSEYGRRTLVEGLGLGPEKVHVVHHGAFEHLLHRPAVPLPLELDGVQEPVVLFFGLLRPYKGIETLLEAWRGVTGAELWVVGNPRLPLAPLQAAAGDGVRFVPRFVSDAELPTYFDRADLVVLPYTRTERLDFSGVLATALAFGKPVVLSDVGSFSEVAELGAARLVPPGDAGALGAVLAELLARPEERARLGEAARAAAAGPYSWAAAAQGMLEVYQSLL
jgi:glycosyltransferase involved in cell wall biosynthesis